MSVFFFSLFPLESCLEYEGLRVLSLGQECSLKDMIHKMYHFPQTSQLPASLLFWLHLVSLTGNIYFNALCIFILDVPQDTLATQFLDRNAELAMKSMVNSTVWFRKMTDTVPYSLILHPNISFKEPTNLFLPEFNAV